MSNIKWLSVSDIAAIDRMVSFWGFLATIPAANWLISNWGTCVPNGPCLIPVWPGVMAPSGVLMIGLALVLRDAVHHTMGVKWVILAILIGAGLSGLFSTGSLVLASGVAFLLSELADLFVYAPLKAKHLYAAVGLSSVVGAIVDSAIFLLLAFGSLNFLTGQIIGKLWAAVFAITFLKTYEILRRPTSSI